MTTWQKTTTRFGERCPASPARRYPEWLERSEADFGMVMLEALSAIGDELSYIQDQGHLQAKIDTATQRDAVTRLARLVDYEPTTRLPARANDAPMCRHRQVSFRRGYPLQR